MGIFRSFKRGGEVTDYARGAPAPKKTVGFTQDGFVDFSARQPTNIDPNKPGNFNLDNSKLENTNKSSGSMFDFLTGGSLSSDNNSSRDLPPPYIGDSYSSGSELDEVKKMVRNVSGMTNDNSNELYKLLQRIELLERKLERLEGKDTSSY